MKKNYYARKKGLPDLLVRNVQSTNEAAEVAVEHWGEQGYGWIDPFTVDLVPLPEKQEEKPKIGATPQEPITDEEITDQINDVFDQLSWSGV